MSCGNLVSLKKHLWCILQKAIKYFATATHFLNLYCCYRCWSETKHLQAICNFMATTVSQVNIGYSINHYISPTCLLNLHCGWKRKIIFRFLGKIWEKRKVTMGFTQRKHFNFYEFWGIKIAEWCMCLIKLRYQVHPMRNLDERMYFFGTVSMHHTFILSHTHIINSSLSEVLEAQWNW